MTVTTDPVISRLVEKQLRNWELARSQRHGVPEPERQEVEDFICVSRMVGVDGHDVVEKLSARLGWPVFAKEVLEAMGGDDAVRRQIYEWMDQRDLKWWEESLFALTERQFVKNDYFHRLCETLLTLARQGSSVFLGRGADLVLPRGRGLRVRLVAPRELRIEWLAEAHGLSKAEAERELEQTERRREEFFRNHFRVSAADPSRHDLALNMSSFTAAEAVDLILAARDKLRGR